MNVFEKVARATQSEIDSRDFGGGRVASLKGITLEQFEKVFGAPDSFGDGEKVTKEFYFSTPRGLFSVHDYWWNAADELSIGARCGHDFRNNAKVALWARRYFRELEQNIAE